MAQLERMATGQEIYLILWDIKPDGNKAQEVIGFKALTNTSLHSVNRNISLLYKSKWFWSWWSKMSSK